MRTHVSYQCREDAAYLTFACDEAGKPNTLDQGVLDELAGRIEEVNAASAQLRAVIVQSDNDRYFIVGANINALQTLTPETIIPWVRKGHAVFSQLQALPLPVIAMVRGYALGGGLELALACDLILASRGAKLGQPEANLGLVSGWGGSYRLPRRVGTARAKELFFTGKVVGAEEAYQLGLVDFVGDDDQLQEHLTSLLEQIRGCGPLAIAHMKRLLNNSATADLERNGLDEAVASSLCLASEDAQRRVSHYLQKRARGK